MLIASEIRPAGTWEGDAAADTVILDFDGRYRRRHTMTGAAGLAFLLDLPQATALRDGDGLVLGDGRIVRVTAEPERLVEIVAPDVPALLRIAWHLGNRHLPIQLVRDRLRIRYDHVIIEMVKGLGGIVAEIDAPFDPEGGAFASGIPHSHGHFHAEPHVHPDADDHTNTPAER
jgi:urease accessory protein